MVYAQRPRPLSIWNIPSLPSLKHTKNWLPKFSKHHHLPSIQIMCDSNHKKHLIKRHNGHCPPYCDCDFPQTGTVLSSQIPDVVKCRCGEEEPVTRIRHWNWYECAEADAEIYGPDIIFHTKFSQGTTIVRGDKPLAVGMVHFWEMRAMTAFCGTDVMVGIGTDKVDLNQFKFHFVSALGTNSQSWGFSYDGLIQHIGVKSYYGQKFSMGCIVGVLLDRVFGTLEFFLNRRSMGVAYTNIPLDPSVKIYPMACSTAAKTCIRLLNTSSQVDSLQLRAFQVISKLPKALKELKQVPGLKPIYNNYWFLAPPIRYSRESKSKEYDMLDEAVLSTQSRLSRKHKHNDDDTDDSNDLYGNAHKIVARLKSESESSDLDEYID